MNIGMASALVALLVAATANGGGAQEIITRRGAEIEGKFVTSISSKTDHRGDAFTLDVKHAFGKSSIPSGSVIEGHIVSVLRATRRHRARMELSLDDLKTPRAQAVPLRLEITSFASAGGESAFASASALTSTNNGDVVVKRGGLLRLKALEDIVLPPRAAAKPAHDNALESTPVPHWRPSTYTDELI